MNAPTRGVVDIGSNAVRFVAYGGSARAPVPLYNEKLPVALGKSVLANGAFDEAVIDQTVRGLVRFRALADAMKIDGLRVVGTAAIRDASNGGELVDRARKLGIAIELLDGDAEAEAAGLGVLSDVPDADGYAADLGGGSLELVRIGHGAVRERISLPLGTTRLALIDNLPKRLASEIGNAGDFAIETGRDLYLVGGVWRALALLDQTVLGYPFHIAANHRIAPERLPLLLATAGDKAALKAMRAIPSSRIEALPLAIALLQQLERIFNPANIFTSACGIREGLLYAALTNEQQAQDPLLACTRFEGERLSRPGFCGDALNRWMTGLFQDESQVERRLRQAACNLADTSWNIHPDHREEHALEIGLYGSWTGIDIAGRMILARALFAAQSGKSGQWPFVVGIAAPEQLTKPEAWGAAMRLAMRLGGGTGAALDRSRVERRGSDCVLVLPEHLDPDAVERRLANLAACLGLSPRIELA
jgi:exopolyphosphatase / guanosine-5'-triphosphate,3'-diphosphate pyrophosphatase